MASAAFSGIGAWAMHYARRMPRHFKIHTTNDERRVEEEGEEGRKKIEDRGREKM
jgi:hypothetical protein